MNSAALKILLIEDNLGDARLVKEALSEISSTRTELTHVTRLQEGLKKILVEDFDVLLLDLSLPDASGLDTVRQTHKAATALPIIVLTGFNDETFAVTVVQEGAQDFLVKGQFDAPLLMRAIRYAIQRKQAQEELTASREFAVNIIESSLDMIIAIDHDGKIAEFNKAAQKTFKYSPSEILSKPFEILYADPAEAKRIREITLVEGKFVGQITNVRSNGEQFPASLSASVLRNQRGEFQGLVSTSRDITEQINLETQLRHAQKMDSIGQLAAGVAHDFNNILTIIQGHASLLLMRKEKLPPELTSPLTEISLAGEHAATLTRQLLTFSRKQTIQPRSLDLNCVIENITKMLTRLIGVEVSLKVQPGYDLPYIHADAGMLEQVIINLAVNARDAMPKGGEIRVHTDLVTIDPSYLTHHPEARPGDFVCLSVADTGTGMDAATLSRIFEPFFTTKETGKGTGLGLATVYGIVQSHQGWIEVESTLGRGTTFKVFFPITNEKLNGRNPAVLDDYQCRGDESIFIVEDVAELRCLVRHILESYGYKVVEAENGVQAMSLWQDHKDKIDLLLTDIMMPEGINGRDLAEKLRAEKENLRVIYTSGHSIDLVSGGLPLQEGINFLQKPYRALALAQTIRSCLDQKTAASR